MSKIERFLEKHDKIIIEDREKTLIALGLTEKEYSPNGKESHVYSKYDYVNGEKKYYREVAVAVTDEEYELILSKVKQVEGIRAKEEAERQKRSFSTSHKVIKKWIPVFEKKNEESLFGDNNEQADTGKSKIAKNIRIYILVFTALCWLGGITVAVNMESFWPVLISILLACFHLVPLVAIVGLLDYIAELASIARNGYQYRESEK